LVASFPAERITASIEVFDWLCERNDKRIARNPAGYLVDSIRKDYAAPKGFISKADREMLEAERRERQRAEVEARRRKAERDARDREEQERITAFLDSLSGKSLADFDAEALEHADPATRAGYEALKGRPFERTMHRRIREAHARRKLGLPAPEDPH
jgi:hypothetical protein